MQININELANKGIMEIDNKVSFPILEDKQIKKLDDVLVKGIIKYTVLDEIELDLDVKGTMYLEDSISLDLVPYDFDFKIAETIDRNNPEYANFFKNKQIMLDISEILWENIVLEVPISYTKEENVSLSGKGWEFNKTQEDDIKGGE